MPRSLGLVLAFSALLPVAYAATASLPEALILKGKPSPFKLRMTMGSSPFYLIDESMGGSGAFWDNQWRFDYDSDEGPNYVNEKRFREALPRFENFCRVMSELGCNATVVGDVIHLVTFDQLVPGRPYAIYGPDSKYRKRHLFYREYFRQLIRIARKYDMDFYIYSDEFVYTPDLAEWIGEISDQNPKLWEAYRAKYEELLTELPEAAGVLLRLGEIYVYQGYAGKDIVDSRGYYPDRYRRLIDETSNVVCKKHGKKYVHRTWTVTENYIHSQPDLYEDVFSGPKKEGLIVSIKHPQTDFWYYQPPNPTIGMCEQDQIVEYQTRREYDGMGVFPAMPWRDYKNDVVRMAGKKNVVGYWLWPNEGGWAAGRNKQPQTHYSFLKGFAAWNEANTYFVAALGHDPKREPREVIREWAAAMYGETAADAITEILLMSARAAETGLYCESYSKRHLWLPDPQKRWFILKLNGYDPYKEYQLPNVATAMTLEGYEPHDIAARQLELFVSVMGSVQNKELREGTLHSLQHQQAFYGMMRDFRECIVAYFQAWHRRHGKPGDATPFQEQFQAAMARWQKSLPDYDRDYGLFNTDELHRGMKMMQDGSATPENFNSGRLW
ncbi:hypothetical protein HS125_07355 [bacterium]|nr:hypothetical protein [bacterium]